MAVALLAGREEVKRGEEIRAIHDNLWRQLVKIVTMKAYYYANNTVLERMAAASVSVTCDVHICISAISCRC